MSYFRFEDCARSPNLGPIWVKRQISQNGTKHLFIALIMLNPLAKKSEKNIGKFQRKLGKRRIFVLKTVPVRPNLAPIWAKRQISQNGTKHLFIALIMLNPLAKKSEKILKSFEEN